ncbi:MAG: hypothetical protein Kow006_01400 [Gammaproteobacteria bacterium]
MKLRNLFVSLFSAFALALFTGTAISADTAADPSEHKFEKAKAYYAQCKGVQEGEFQRIKERLKAFTDMEVMAEHMEDPVKFAQLMQTLYDPRTLHVMMSCTTEPVMWDTWLKGLTDFDKMFRVGMRFMNPAIYMNWMMAPMNPQVWGPMMTFMDPNLWGRWTVAMGNPAFYQPFFAFFDPNWYTPRLNWMMNPNSYQPIYDMFNVAVPTTTTVATPQQ